MAQPYDQRPSRLLCNPGRRRRTRMSQLTSPSHPLIPISQVFSPAKVIFAGVGVLLLVSIALDPSMGRFQPRNVSQAAKDIDASQDALADLFESIENFLKRLASYTTVRPTAGMTDIIVKIMVEVLNIFAIATKEMKQGRASACSL